MKVAGRNGDTGPEVILNCYAKYSVQKNEYEDARVSVVKAEMVAAWIAAAPND